MSQPIQFLSGLRITFLGAWRSQVATEFDGKQGRPLDEDVGASVLFELRIAGVVILTVFGGDQSQQMGLCPF